MGAPLFGIVFLCWALPSSLIVLLSRILVIVSHIMLVFVWCSLLLTRDVYTDIRDVITELILMGDSS